MLDTRYIVLRVLKSVTISKVNLEIYSINNLLIKKIFTEFVKRRSELLANMSGDNFDKLVKEYCTDVAKETEKYNRLKELEIFVLDNSIRESTVGKFNFLFTCNLPLC